MKEIEIEDRTPLMVENAELKIPIRYVRIVKNQKSIHNLHAQMRDENTGGFTGMESYKKEFIQFVTAVPHNFS